MYFCNCNTTTKVPGTIRKMCWKVSSAFQSNIGLWIKTFKKFP